MNTDYRALHITSSMNSFRAFAHRVPRWVSSAPRRPGGYGTTPSCSWLASPRPVQGIRDEGHCIPGSDSLDVRDFFSYNYTVVLLTVLLHVVHRVFRELPVVPRELPRTYLQFPSQRRQQQTGRRLWISSTCPDLQELWLEQPGLLHCVAVVDRDISGRVFIAPFDKKIPSKFSYSCYSSWEKRLSQVRRIIIGCSISHIL